MGKSGIFSLVFSLLCFTLSVLPARAAFEWSLGEGENCRVVPDEPALRFPGGFKATVRFACDLSKIGERSNHANLFCKGRSSASWACRRAAAKFRQWHIIADSTIMCHFWGAFLMAHYQCFFNNVPFSVCPIDGFLLSCLRYGKKEQFALFRAG